jgi:dTDP-4-amino-4,6-dideoxygalactose transaminase
MIHLSKPLIGAEELAAVEKVLRSGWLAAGPESEAFVRRLRCL